MEKDIKYVSARDLEDLLFCIDEAELTPEGKKAYDLLSKRLKTHLNEKS